MPGHSNPSGPLAAHIETGDLKAVEDAWLARVAEAPEDIPFFADTARALTQAGVEEQAVFLLQILDEQLCEDGRWMARLALLRRSGMLMTAGDGAALHTEIVRTLEAAHPGHTALRPMAEKLGLFRAIEDLPKLWGKVERLLELLPFDSNTVVRVEGQGPGRVIEANFQLGSFRVALADGKVLGVGFAAAGKMLHPLPPGHVMHRALEDPEGLRKLASEDPPELVRIALESYSEPLSAKELREALQPIVPDGEWTSFWNRARKHPQILVMPGPRQRYHWAESARDAVASLSERFASAPLEERLDLLRRHRTRDPELRELMVGDLLRQVRELAPQEAYPIAVALERAGAGDDRATSPEALLGALDDPLGFIETLEDRGLREDAVRRLQGVRADWPALYQKAMLKEDDPRLLDRLAAELAGEAPERLESVIQDLLSNPKRNPLGFVWLAERAAEDEALQRRAPLRLFQLILQGIGDSSFATARRRLISLTESGGTLPRLLPLLEPDQASSAEEALARTGGLEDYQRTPLRNALHLRFPELRPAEESPLYATPEAIEAKREELRALLEEELPANRRAIEIAREMGDLRENFEYKSARQRHEYLSARASSLHRDLARARPVDAATVDRSAVRVGTRVLLEGPDGDRAFTILGPWDSRPEDGVLSSEADVARLLLGKTMGEEVEIEGQLLRVAAIEPYR